MAKKDTLKAQMGRPSLKRTQPTNEAVVKEVVERVATPPESTSENNPKGGDRPQPGRTKSNDQTEVDSASTRSAHDASSHKHKQGGKSRKKATGDSTNSSKSASKAVADQDQEPMKRLTIDIPESLHRQLKLDSIRRGVYMKDHIIALIEKSLK